MRRCDRHGQHWMRSWLNTFNKAGLATNASPAFISGIIPPTI